MRGNGSLPPQKIMKTKLPSLLPFLLAATASPALAQQVWYVDASNPAAMDLPGYGILVQFPYDTVQYAIDQAAPGDTINIMPGTYVESLYVTKELKLEGMPRATMQMPPGASVLLEIDAGAGDIGAGMVVQGLDFVANSSGGFQTGLWMHNDWSETMATDISPLIQGNSFTDFGIGIVIESYAEGTSHALIRHNHITSTKDLDTAPSAFGITFQTLGGSIDAQTRSNLIEKAEWGIGLLADWGAIRSLHASDRIMRCEWGMVATGDAVSDAVHQTIGFGHPASPVPDVKGIESWMPSQVTVTNSIIWIPDEVSPDGFAVNGIDLLGDGIVLDSFTTVEDNGDPNPQFVDPANFDLHLQSTSPYLDAANNTPIQPGAALEVATDNDGRPRVLDHAFDGTMIADRGAHEYTMVDLDLLSSAYPGYSPSGERFPQIRDTGAMTFELTGPPNSLYFLWVQPKLGEFNNLSFASLGNLLLLPQLILSQGVMPATGQLSLNYSLNGAAAEAEWEAQAVFVSVVAPGDHRGAFSRRMDIEINP